MKVSTFFKFVVVIGYTLSSTIFAKSAVEALTGLSLTDKAPIVYQQQTLSDGFESFYFDGATYQGKPTRVFAYYKKPEGEGPFPAMVLVHGGGGSAYKKWITKWNSAGFAAISIAVEGQTGTLTGNKKPKWQQHDQGGPSRAGIYNDSAKPLTGQWMYHATAATINAHNLLRSFANINPKKIGLSGISWGGVITSTVMGFDQRFAFAIPIYGSGFLAGMDNQYGKALKNNNIYREVWEPALRIAKFKKPTFWLTGLKERHFSLDAQASTYKLVSAEHIHSIQPALKHGHIAGWTPKEPYLFAQAVINNEPLVSFYQQKRSKDTISIRVKEFNDISVSSLYYTNDTGHTSERKFTKLPVTVKKEETSILLTSPLPLTATAWFFNIEKNGLIYSSEFSE